MEIRISSTSVPLKNLPLLQSLVALLNRTAAMGILRGTTVTRIDAETVGRVIDALQDEKLLAAAPLGLEPLLQRGPADLSAVEARRMQAAVDAIVETLGESPAPATEWIAMRDVFGDEVLSQLVGVSESSLRRYGAGARTTPQHIAERLHWLAMVVADLAGGYNGFGIRRWFERARPQLDGRSPRELLGPDWGVDDPAAERVRALAATLTGAQVLAA